jgi:protoporphyrinogen oxidase
MRRCSTDERVGPARSGVAPVVVIGAGPAGLTAAFELSKQDRASVVLEADESVGGIARTAEYKGYLFDIGGHRFFTKIAVVNAIWRAVLGSDFISRPRLSRIFFNGKFFRYPLERWDTLARLGPLEALGCLASWAKAVLSPKLPERDLKTWVTNRFGRRLFENFFETYTEKAGGMRCDQISADWAEQRIRGMSFRSVALHARGLHRLQRSRGTIKSLIDRFDYPRRGPGMMWSRMRALIEARHARVVLHAPVTRIAWTEGCVTEVEAGGTRYCGEQFLSSMPIRDFILALDPPPPPELLDVASCFQYRDFLTVVLIVRERAVFPDNWIYIHEPAVKVGRIQNYKNWSPEMVPDPETTCLGLEYFCFEVDALWSMADDDLVRLAKDEIAKLGLVRSENVLDGTVVRTRKAYPVYNDVYRKGLDALRDFLRRVPNMQWIGRNGMHQHNNQDHSMLTAILAVRNILGAEYDLWQVNIDGGYREEGREITSEELTAYAETFPAVPSRIDAAQ